MRDGSTPLSTAERDAVLRLADAAAAVDGGSALSEQFRLGVEWRASDGVRHVLATDDSGAVVGYAQSRGDESSASAELVVAQAARRRGVGTALLAELPAGARVWSHVDSEAARGFAAARGLEPVRSLLVLGRSLTGAEPWPDAQVPEAYAVRSFERGRDEDEWLRVNAAAFARHPEQGALTRADLEQRMAQPWFDPVGLILVVESGEPSHVVAFHWTKVDPPDGARGEVYVVGVDPAHQGEGLGRAVTILGLDHLRDRGLAEVVLYVDEENEAAVHTYRSLGFDTLEVHRQYAAGGSRG